MAGGTIVAGVDFGTLSVRVSLVDSERGRLGAGIGEYPLSRRRDDPDFATQRHADHMGALTLAMRQALGAAGVDGSCVAAIAVDTTGSSVIPVGEGLVPLDDYYLWCDHRAWREAEEITSAARARKLPALDWCGGVYSSEWGFAKLLHWLRHNPDKRGQFVTALEHCDMAAAVLCGITDPRQLSRSVCAMGHKWLWNPALGGFPSNDFFVSVDPLLDGIGERLGGAYRTSDHVAGGLSAEWAARLGLREGIPVAVGAFDAHWDAMGAGVRLGDVVNVVGTSTCIMAVSTRTEAIPGLCGVVPGSVHPRYTGVEAGLSATGDIFEAIARRAGTTVAELSKALDAHRAGDTGLLRLTWDNGDRTVLVNPALGGITLGWTLTHQADDELFAAIEGCAMHTRIILEQMERHGVPIERVINGGGIPQRNAVLNQVYANVLGKPILLPSHDVTGLGAALFAFVAAGAFETLEEAQAALCPSYREFHPDPAAVAVYGELFPLFERAYFAFGRADSAPVAVGDILPSLRRIAAENRR